MPHFATKYDETNPGPFATTSPDDHDHDDMTLLD
jgi:hypothetical protein